MKRILIVDDDPAFSDIFTIVFQTYGFYVDRLNEVNKLFELKDNLPDVISTQSFLTWMLPKRVNF